MSDDRNHSKYGGSIAHRYFACPGSVKLCAPLPNMASEYAEEGTFAHKLLELRLVKWYYVEGRDTHFPMLMDKLAEMEAKASSDMKFAVDTALEFVFNVFDEYPDAELFLEKRFEIPSEAAPGEVFGTNDILIYVPSMRLLYVVDYKHGAGVYVEARGNKQLRFYAVGAMSLAKDWAIETIALVIIQPRYPNAAPVREEWVDAAEIIEFHGEIDAAIRRSQEPDAPLIPGEHQCQFCPAKDALVCPAREKQALASVQSTFSDVRLVTKESLPDVNTMTPDRIGYSLGMAVLAEDWFKAVRARAFALVQQGVHIPGHKLVRAQAKRKFNVDEANEDLAVFEVSEELSAITEGRVDPGQFRRLKLVGVTEAEKIIKDDARDHAEKGQKKKAVEEATVKFAFTTTKKSSGSLSLVPDSDPRPAIDPKSAFADVTVLPIITGEQANDEG